MSQTAKAARQYQGAEDMAPHGVSLLFTLNFAVASPTRAKNSETRAGSGKCESAVLSSDTAPSNAAPSCAICLMVSITVVSFQDEIMTTVASFV